MSRQHATPLLLLPGQPAQTLSPLALGAGPGQISEADLQQLLHDNPACLPIAEIDSLFANPVAICTELNTPAGPIDNFMVTASGLPVLVECKLWRNPEGRREVVGQILDYAKELSRWSASDIQREVARRVKGEGNPILELLKAAGHPVDEVAFADALTHNLRRGRFLLLIVGDGIREGVEAIAEYLQVHAGLHFSLGLVEMPIFLAGDGARLVVPRVLARTHVITRTVVATPEGMAVQDGENASPARETDPEITAWSNERQQFWTEFQAGLKLDDPEQAVGKPPRMGYTTLTMPAPGGVSWLTIYRDMTHGEVGIFLSYHFSSLGERIAEALANDREDLLAELGGTARIVDNKGKPRLLDSYRPGAPLDAPAAREAAIAWLRGRTNDFVNALRPRIRTLASDLKEEP